MPDETTIIWRMIFLFLMNDRKWLENYNFKIKKLKKKPKNKKQNIILCMLEVLSSNLNFILTLTNDQLIINFD